MITNKHITKQQSDLMKNVFGVLREKTVSGSFRTGLVHGDLSLRNIIVNDEGMLPIWCTREVKEKEERGDRGKEERGRREGGEQ